MVTRQYLCNLRKRAFAIVPDQNQGVWVVLPGEPEGNRTGLFILKTLTDEEINRVEPRVEPAGVHGAEVQASQTEATIAPIKQGEIVQSESSYRLDNWGNLKEVKQWELL